MFLPDEILAATVIVVLAAACATLVAHLFVRTGVPGGPRSAGLVGGVVLGLLGGVGVLGVMAPGAFEAWVEGGVTERRVLVEHDAETEAHVTALRLTGVSPEAIPEYADERRTMRGPLLEDLAEARGERTALMRGAAQALLALALLLTAPYWLGAQRSDGRPKDLGVVGALLAVAFGALLMRGLTPDIPTLITTAVVIACATLAPAPSKRTPSALVMPILVAFFACVSAARLLHSAQHNAAPPGAIGSSMMVMTGVGLMLAWPMYHALGRATLRLLRRRAAAFALLTLVPASIAISLLRIDPHALWTDWVFWAIALGAGIASNDLRWYALATLLRGLNRERPYTDAEASANAGGGIVQLVVATSAYHAALIDDRVFLALLIGAVMGEMTVALRARIARAMQEGRSIVDAVTPRDDEA